MGVAVGIPVDVGVGVDVGGKGRWFFRIRGRKTV